MSNKADNMENMNGVCEKAESRTENLSTNVADILSRIDMIIVQGNTLKDVVMQIQNIPINDSPLGGEDGAQRARAINNIYSAREATNQKLIDLLEKMYNNITQQKTFCCDKGKMPKSFLQNLAWVFLRLWEILILH